MQVLLIDIQNYIHHMVQVDIIIHYIRRLKDLGCSEIMSYGCRPNYSIHLTYMTDESTMKSEYGDVLNITSDNNDLKDILHNLFYDILNIEFNLWCGFVIW